MGDQRFTAGQVRLSIGRFGFGNRCIGLGHDARDPPTPTLVAISSSLTPASAASKICARLSLRAACLPP
jgi:hypothetical protein